MERAETLVKRNTPSGFLLTLLLVGSLIAAPQSAWAGPSAAADGPSPTTGTESDDPSPRGGPVPCGTTVTISNVKAISDRTSWPNSADWRVDGKGPGTLSISRTLSSTNSVTATGGASYSAISASVGFNVSQSTTVTTSYSITLAPGEQRQIQVGQVWQQKSFTWTKRSGCAGNISTTTGTGVASKFMRFTYRSVKI